MWAAVIIVGVAAAGIGGFAGPLGRCWFSGASPMNAPRFRTVLTAPTVRTVRTVLTVLTVPTVLTAQPNTLSLKERAEGWRMLFDGRTLGGWRGLGYDSVPTAHWKVENGAIRKIPNGEIPRLPDGQPAKGGDLMTIATFGDFEVVWEWKIGRAGNSGLKYNVSEELSMAVAPNHAAIGFEYQLLDDDLNEDNKLASHRSGALYDMIPPSDGKTLKPVGEWNSSTLLFRGTHAEHWLNGVKVVEFDLGAPRVDSLLRLSKYKNIKDFAVRKQGHIVLQDHGEEVFFRSIKLRELGREP